MCILQTFCCCLDLFMGCIIIGIMGTLYTTVGIFVVIHKFESSHQLWCLAAIVVLCIFLIFKVFLLYGTVKDIKGHLLIAFVGHIICIILYIALLIGWIILIGTAIHRIFFAGLFILLEMYFTWIIFSFYYMDY